MCGLNVHYVQAANHYKLQLGLFLCVYWIGKLNEHVVKWFK